MISNYDAQTDKSLTSLQRKLETFFVNLEAEIGTSDADYEQYKSFYRTVKVDISAIKLRVEALSRNEITIEQVASLQENLDLLEEIHQQGIISIQLVTELRREFNTAIASILKLELAKQREAYRGN